MNDEWNDEWGRIRLRSNELKFLRRLLLEDRDLFFEEKRELDAAGEPSVSVLRDIRSLEKVLRNVEGTIWDLEAGRVGDSEPGKTLCPTCDGRGHVWVFPAEVANG